MYIIAIAWLYVTVLMAASSDSLARGLLTFLLLGIAPVALLIYVADAPRRRSRRMRQASDDPHRGHAQADE
jgi:biotin transporter BioY